MRGSSFDPARISRQLARICDSPQFRSAGRLREFLTYIVLETIGGREEHIKEYTIATDVYGRGVLFDPKLDSIVRVEAIKMRARLAAYYAQAGLQDDLVICVPKGGYVPEFRNQASPVDQGRASSGQIAELCDLGSVSLLRRTPAAIAAAIHCFTSARNLNPAEARAHIGLADSYVASLDIETAPPRDVLNDLNASVSEGLRLDGDSAYAHVVASRYRATAEGIGQKAAKEARCALNLEPHNVMGHFWAAGLLSAEGLHETAIQHMHEAGRSAPYCVLFRAYLGRVLYYAGRYRRALSVLSDVTSADPALAVGHMWTALAHSELRQHDQAVHAGLRAASLSETSATLGSAAYVLARAGRTEDAAQIFDRLRVAPPYEYVSPLQLAMIAHALNRPEAAAMYFSEAQRENAYALIWRNVDPRIKRMRSTQS